MAYIKNEPVSFARLDTAILTMNYYTEHSTAEDDRKLDEEVSAILSGVVSSKDNYTTELDMYGGFTMETCLSFDPFMKTITTLTEKLLTLRETHKAYIEMKSRLDIHSVDWNTAELGGIDFCVYVTGYDNGEGKSTTNTLRNAVVRELQELTLFQIGYRKMREQFVFDNVDWATAKIDSKGRLRLTELIPTNKKVK